MAKMGDRGAEVRALQHALGVTIDGVFGSGTKSALVAYQSANGLLPDGVAGVITWAKLDGDLQTAEERPLSLGAFFAGVRQLFGGGLNQVQVDGLNTLLPVVSACCINQAAYMLATAYHETAHTMQPIVERGNAAYFGKYDTGKLAERLGNTPAADKDGYLYRGRGYVQLTGRENYINAGRMLGVPLAASPDLALQPDIAAKIMQYGMSDGWFTGKRLSDYIGWHFADYINARRIINGTDRAADIAGYALVFELALRRAMA